jgi:hypothetical protein
LGQRLCIYFFPHGPGRSGFGQGPLSPGQRPRNHEENPQVPFQGAGKERTPRLDQRPVQRRIQPADKRLPPAFNDILPGQLTGQDRPHGPDGELIEQGHPDSQFPPPGHPQKPIAGHAGNARIRNEQHPFGHPAAHPRNHLTHHLHQPRLIPGGHLQPRHISPVVEKIRPAHHQQHQRQPHRGEHSRTAQVQEFPHHRQATPRHHGQDKKAVPGNHPYRQDSAETKVSGYTLCLETAHLTLPGSLRT